MSNVSAKFDVLSSFATRIVRLKIAGVNDRTLAKCCTYAGLNFPSASCVISADLFFNGKSGISKIRSKWRKKAGSMPETEFDNQIIGTLLFSNN